jgi:hypothetical protein
MITYGSGPESDEIEVCLFGPGFGEAIAVHLGSGNWLLVDSCIDPDSKKPASEAYLSQIGVASSQVRVIVASHWHDDHVRGLSRLASAFPQAELQISAVFSNDEARAFLAAYSGNAAPVLARGTRELYHAVGERAFAFTLQQRSIVLELQLPLGRRIVRATAFAPVPAAVAGSLARMAGYVPGRSANEPIGHAPELQPNLEAVVLHIDWGDMAVLLGADLEEHSSYGWSAVVADQWCSARKPAGVYKVAHHGSGSGDIPSIWKVLLEQEPIVSLTPFTLGRHRLPGDQDRVRIRGNTPHAYITSGASRKPKIENEKLKRLSDICTGLSPSNSGFGATRIRRKFGEKEWRVELLGDAQRL